MLLTFRLLAIASLSLLGLVACNQASTNTNSRSTTSPVAEAPSTASPAATATATTTNAETGKQHSHGGQGGQVVETGEYHLELVTLKEGNGTHLDFYLQKGDKHEAVPNATVTAQVQLPDGTQKALPLQYDKTGQHYYAVLSDTTPGDYKVAILSDINGKKVNARYSFKY